MKPGSPVIATLAQLDATGALGISNHERIARAHQAGFHIDFQALKAEGYDALAPDKVEFVDNDRLCVVEMNLLALCVYELKHDLFGRAIFSNLDRMPPRSASHETDSLSELIDIVRAREEANDIEFEHLSSFVFMKTVLDALSAELAALAKA